ncbi:MAG: exopolysaccharide Pel transporter PelG, partial [Alphaproteobacteria bacterium]
AYNCAIWIDKWIFWLSPSYATSIAGIPIYPAYDGAMFYAHLTLAPGLAVFFALIETGFYSHYRRFYWCVQNHGTLLEIEDAQKELEANAASGMRILLALHVAIAVGTLLLAPAIAEALSLMPTQIGIFRFAVVGTAAHAFFLYALILMAYFDMRRRVLILSCLFLVLNAVLTLVTQQMGYSFFGAGYFLAALISAAAAFALAQREFGRLRYLTLVGNNPSTGRSL